MPYSLVTFVFAPFYLGSWQDGHPMTTMNLKKGIHHSKIYEIVEKAESSSHLAIYKPHSEKILFLHMPKGAL